MRIVWIMLCLFLAACGPEPTGVPPGAQPGINTPSAKPTNVSTPAPKIEQAEQAITLAQQKFPELSAIKSAPANAIGAASNIWTISQPDGWNLVFWQGDGDCPAGCINNHYWYVSVSSGGDTTLVGEYVRAFDSAANTMQTRGQPLWGIPK